MSKNGLALKEPEILRSLEKLKQEPINAEGSQDAILTPIYTFLMAVPPGEDRVLHWFCHKARPTVVEASTFLLRLHAYSNNSNVDAWKERLAKILHGCCACVQSYTEIKVTCRNTYFSAFSKQTLDNFFAAVDKWEVDITLDALATAGVVSGSKKSVSDSPPAVLYHILVSLHLLNDIKILTVLREHPPCIQASGWPHEVPPGLLLLLFSESSEIRTWTQQQLSRRPSLTLEQFSDSYDCVLQSVATALTSVPYTPETTSAVTKPMIVYFTMPISQLWSSLQGFLRWIPESVFISRRHLFKMFKSAIIGHLHDKSSHFPDVLRAFVFLLNKYGKAVWDEENDDFPQVVFDSIKDNTAFISLIQTTPIDTSQSPWALKWFQPYLASLDDMPRFEQALKKLTGFACEELQHERFESKRPIIMACILHVFEMYAPGIIEVALSSKRNAPCWHQSREAARRLLSQIINEDFITTESTIFRLSKLIQETSVVSNTPSTIPSTLPRHDTFWRLIFSTFSGGDTEAMELLVMSAGLAAAFDNLNAVAYNPSSFPSGLRDSLAVVITSVNVNLNDARSGFLDAVTQFTNSSSNTPDVIQKFISNELVLKNLVALLLSPVEELQMASQILVGQAYDVDVRSECFRVLLERHPGPSLHALTSTLQSFVEIARILPEACGFAKTLVRCMTDVIEVLTNGRDGLFLNGAFCKTFADVCRSHLPQFWQAMCQSITTIFRRTPSWSRVIDTEAMTDWMRDALIFARDMLAQWRTFEKAASADNDAQSLILTPRKPSSVDKQMLNDMQTILTESIRWLRLTDLELLHQSSTLVQSLLSCFQDVGLQPLDGAIRKLEKFLESARRVSTPQALRTKLPDTHLSELASLLASFSQADVIETPPHSKPLEPTPEDREASKPLKDSSKIKEVALEGRTSSSTIHPAPTNRTLSYSRPGLVLERQSGSRIRASDESSKKTVATKNAAKVVKVSDSSSSDTSGEEETGGLAALSKLQKSPVVKKTMKRRGIKMMEPLFSGNNATLERIRKYEEAQRAALRMQPDLRPLYRLILSWNYHHEGSEPPYSERRRAYTAIPDKFRSGEEYQTILEPLLALECWNQLIKSKEEAVDSLTARINSRQYVDNFLELDVSITERIPDKWRLSETDIVLLRQPDQESSILSKVHASRRTATDIQATLHCLTDANGSDPGLHINTQWKISKVFSLSTVSREFAALKGLPYYDFYSEILNPRLAKIPEFPLHEIQKAKNAYRVNEPQAIAILSAMKTEGFTLIQGPPGTGKTWTICGIVGAFLSTRPRPATIIQAGRSAIPERTPALKILVCAPSNAAIDEVAKRLRDGVRTSDGELVIPKIVRIGAEDAMNVSIQDISLDQLVDQRLNGTVKEPTGPSNSSSTLMSLRAEMDALKEARVLKLTELTNTTPNVHRRTVLEEELKTLNNKRTMLSQQYNRMKDQRLDESRAFDAARRKFKAEVLQEVDVICSTLSGSGHDVLKGIDFDTVVIDEAAQSVELSSLIPLRYRVKRCIMVGDPQQLPPTVLSPLASNKRLSDGPDMATKTAQPWHLNSLFQPFKFIDVAKGGEQPAQSGHSLVNIQECDVAVALYNRIRKEYSKVDLSFRVGVISMYRAQLIELRHRFKLFFGSDILANVDFNTVDGFQGQEKDIIILSCVRAGPGVTSIGFLSDHRRLNVAITRARSSLFILGHAATLSRSDDIWRIIVEEARVSGALLVADASTFRKFNSHISVKGPPERISETNVVLSPSVTELNPSVTTLTIKPHSRTSSKLPKTETITPPNQLLPPLINLSQKRSHSPDTSESSRKKTTKMSEDVGSELTKPRPPQLPPVIKKKPKEVNIFIPKKNTKDKRPAPEAGPSHGSAKRRIMDQFRQD
ncbi:hypothetical protein Clacol_009863 [Clathrus columnatus]|uniref:Uncharacterized protein n=1 Tax=Clathrus columnatus TaxID=1419009 RepID=A0AAV5AME3_9AGAM|nr:hypothetical protein Clacol_009863 [Clathrus columnatus]